MWHNVSMDPLLIIGIAVLIVLTLLWLNYNHLITLRERIKEALSTIEVQLKRRADLIPNLVESVKGYAKHEKDLLENVTKARSELVKAGTLQQKAAADNQISEALKSIFAVAEGYPDLKANQNFLELQQELSDTENKISYARQFYNSNVLAYNIAIKTFPGIIFANMFHFNESELFAATDEEKKEIKIKF